MSKKTGTPLLTLALAVLMTSGCDRVRFDNREIRENLAMAGSNADELVKAMEYFEEKGDPEQLEAIRFLVENMLYHRFEELAFVGPTGVEIPLDVESFESHSAIISYLADQQKEHGSLLRTAKETVYDLKRVTSQYLIDNVELAFEAWREKPWSHRATFEQFLEYVLPYRVGNERLEVWRPFFLQRYESIRDRMAGRDETDPVLATNLITGDLTSWFQFDDRFYLNSIDQSVSQMLARRRGRCEDTVSLAAYAMRANGLAVAADFTPHWGHSNGNHSWNVLITREKEYPFGGESTIGTYRMLGKVAKAYRTMFSKQEESLYFQVDPGELIPNLFTNIRLADVTSHYGPVVDVDMAWENEPRKGERFAYVAVFNSGEWREVGWGRIEGSHLVFRDLGVDNLYLPLYYGSDGFRPAAPAFIIEADSSVRTFAGQDDALRVTLGKRAVEATEVTLPLPLLADTEYQLLYWQDAWIPVGKKRSRNGKVVFHEVPAGRLYRLVSANDVALARVFEIDAAGEQRFW